MRALTVFLASTLLLTGCTQQSQPQSGIVVSSQNYASIAKALMGDNPDAQFDVHVLLSNDTIDPHEFEPSAKDKLAVSEAELVFYAGTDFDSFVNPLLDSVNFDKNYVLSAADYIDKSSSCKSELCLEQRTNPHLWFDLANIAKVSKNLTNKYIALRPELEADYKKAGEAFQNRILEIQTKQASIAKLIQKRSTFFAPEAIANVLLLELGIKNASSKTIADKISNEVELSLLEMQQIKDLILSSGVSLVAANQQVESVQADELISVAKSTSTPIVYFSESTLCQNKNDAFLDCFDKKIDDVVELLGVKLD